LYQLRPLCLHLSPGGHFFKNPGPERSCKKKSVPRDLLTRVIETAGFAPTGGNTQPVEWLVIEDTNEVRRLTGLVADWQRTLLQEGTEPLLRKRMERIVKAWDEGIDRICRQAPHLIVAHGPGDLPASLSSCTIALTYLELIATSFGLGTCWAGYFNTAANSYLPLLNALALPPGHLPFGAMMIGYPKYHYQRIPLRNKPKITWR
jgi:nitroreductase